MNPRDMALYAISCTLTIASGLVVSGRRQTLMELSADGDKTRRAAQLIFTDLLRQLVSKQEPSAAGFKGLLDQLADLSRQA